MDSSIVKARYGEKLTSSARVKKSFFTCSRERRPCFRKIEGFHCKGRGRTAIRTHCWAFVCFRGLKVGKKLGKVAT